MIDTVSMPLTAETDFNKGETVFVESPFAIFTPVANQRDVVSCANCKKPIDSFELQAKNWMSKKLNRKRSIDSREDFDRLFISSGSSSTYYRCERKCSDFFCSEICQQEAAKYGHRFFCSEESDDRNLHDFISFSLHSNETMFFAAQLYVKFLLSAQCDRKFYEEMKYEITSLHHNHREMKVGENDNAADETYAEAWMLLSSVLISNLSTGNERVKDFFSLSCFSNLIREVEKNLLPLQMESPLSKQAKRLPLLSKDEKISVLKQLNALIPDYLQINWNSDVDIERKSFQLLQAIEDPVRNIFSPFGMVALHHQLQNISHSCLPNTQLESEFKNGIFVTKLTALHSINQGEQLTVSYVNTNQNIQERRKELQLHYRNPLFECQCIRCLYEVRVKKSEKTLLSSVDAFNMANQAMVEGKFMKAHHLYCHVVESSSSATIMAGDALHGMGAALLSLGQWKAAHKIWQVGKSHYPSHQDMSNEVSKFTAYESSSNDLKKQCANPRIDYMSLSENVYVTKTAILTEEECQFVLKTVEEFATSNNGWTTSRHYAVPTTDIPIHQVPDLLTWFIPLLKTKIYPLLSMQFNLEPPYWHIHDAFVVKYHFLKQKYLPIHTDQSTHSLTIALNSTDEYCGGGTYFVHTDSVYRIDKGCVLSFKGTMEHGGDPLLSGTRYIIAVFLYYEDKSSSSLPNHISSLPQMFEQSEDLTFSFNFDGNDNGKQ